jgi:hypothetical protein
VFVQIIVESDKPKGVETSAKDAEEWFEDIRWERFSTDVFD